MLNVYLNAGEAMGYRHLGKHDDGQRGALHSAPHYTLLPNPP